MLPAGVETKTPSEINFFIMYFDPFLIEITDACLLCLKIDTSFIAKNFLIFFLPATFISSGSQKIIKKLVSDGILVSTPAGSTAYNMSVHGPILNLNSKKISIAPISAFRPRRWKGKVVSEKSKLVIKNLDPKKRPISAVADNSEVRNAKRISIKVNRKIKFNLLYDKNSNLQKKIKLEKLRKEIY